MLYGCSARPVELAKIEPREAETAAQPLRLTPEPGITSENISVMVEPYVLADEESRIVLPKVSGCGAEDKINAALKEKISECVNSLSEPVWSEYTIKTNDHGIFSLLVQVYSLKDGTQLALLPLTLDTGTGEFCRLSAYFDQGGERWRYTLPEIVEAQAKRRGITLLSELLPIKDDQSYYILTESEDSKLVLLFRPYEITTYAAGTPQFFIPISEIQDLLCSDSALLRLI